MNELEEIHRNFKQLIGLNRMEIKVDFDFFAILFEIEWVLIFLFEFIFFDNRLGNLLEVFFVEFLKFWSEDFLEDLVYFNIMSQLDDSVGLIDDKIFQVFKVEYLVLEKFVNTTWCTDDNIRSALLYDTQLLLLWHTTDNRNDRDFAFNMLQDLPYVLFNLLGQLSCWGDDQSEEYFRKIIQTAVFGEVK